MLQLDSCSSPVDTITSHHYFSVFIGCVRQSEYHTNWPYYSTSVSVDLRRPTWLALYSLSPDYLVDNACARRRLRYWLYH